MTCTVFAVLGFSAISAYGQQNLKEGYIIQVGNDTIIGMVDDRGAVRNAKVVSFASPEGDRKVFSPETLNGYGVSGKDYRAITLGAGATDGPGGAKKYFMLMLEEGTVDLYYMRDENNKDRYFIQDQKGQVIELTNEATIKTIQGQQRRSYSNQYLAVLRIALTGCERVDNLSINVKWDEKDITKLLRQYNNCFRDEKVDEASFNEKKIFIRKEIQAGIGYSTVVLSGDDAFYIPEGGMVSPSATVGVSISSTTMNRAISIRLALDYLKKGAEKEEGIDFQYHYLNLRVYPSYNYPKGMIRPMVAGGLVVGRRLGDNEIPFYRKFVYSKNIRTTVLEARQDEWGIGGEIGADLYLSASSKSSISLRIGYINTKMNLDFIDAGYKNQTSYVKIGYAF
jgi:hypothetical protein